MNRLSPETARSLPADVTVPAYQRAQLTSGIVHIGPGAFFRAHLAEYTDTALQQDGQACWGITAVAPRSVQTVEQLAPQSGLFTRTCRDGSGEDTRLIGSVLNCLSARMDHAAALAAIAHADTRIISLTITEKGYRQSEKDSPPNESAATAPELLLHGLSIRREAGLSGLSLLSCDNLSGNGQVLAKLLLESARARDPALADWIEQHCSFPNTMVDRIVPASTNADKATLAQRLGLLDEAAVFTEPFSQWIIEDNFCRGRPNWEQAGALPVRDVTPFEHMKLRLLNASHSAIAWCGQLTGYATVDAAISQPLIRQWITQLMLSDAAPTLAMPEGFDLNAYSQSLLTRFANPALAHATAQIATDSSQKISQRLVPVLLWHRQRGQLPPATCFALALWFHYLSGCDEHGNRLAINDPLAESLTVAARQPAAEAVAALLADKRLFPAEMAIDNALCNVASGVLEDLRARGCMAALQAAMTGEHHRYA